MVRVEKSFPEIRELQPLLCLRYNKNILYNLIHKAEELKKMMEKFNNFTPTLNYIYQYIFLLLLCLEAKKTSVQTKATDYDQYLHYFFSHP